MINARRPLSSKRGNLFGLFRLARPLNLVIGAGTLLIMRHGWMGRWEPEGQFTQLPEGDFLLGVAVVVLLMAGGNIINAYFDVAEDRINRPEIAIVDRSIKRRVLIIAHVLLHISGLSLAILVSWRHGTWGPALVATLVSVALWKYSARWKGIPVLGNVVVAGMMGLVPIWLALLEAPLHDADLWRITWPLLGFAGMAFGVGLTREIVKDARDEPGDRSAGKQSIPIRFGMRTAQWIVMVLLFGLTATYVFAAWSLDPSANSMAWVSWMLPLPFMLLAMTAVAGRSPRWKLADRLLLLTLVSGFLQCLWLPGF